MRSPFPTRTVGRIVRDVLTSEKKPRDLDVNVVFVDNEKIRALSKKFLNQDHETDVIAFPYTLSSPRMRGPFGDIFISLPMAKYNADRFGEPYKAEVVRLIVHGTLHLLGYSDHKRKEKKKMWSKQEKLVQRFNKLFL